MRDRLPAGPYREVDWGGAGPAPWYMIPFDKQGRCEGPATRQALCDDLARGPSTHVYLFCHGWNTTWKAASEDYAAFFGAFRALREKHRLALPGPYRPLLLGVTWPSTALVFRSEDNPGIAAAVGEDSLDGVVDQERREVAELAADLDAPHVEEFHALVQGKELLDEAEARRLATLLTPLCAGEGEDDLGSEAVEDLLEVWRRGGRQEAAAVDDSGEGGEVGSADASPQAAGGALDYLDPRWIVRVTTVLRMKDRAGKVGATGLRELLHDALNANRTPSFHLIGHSYGCKALLSALCRQQPPRPVDSLLLLQPAISHLCFAPAAATGTGRDGGYAKALDPDWVRQPVLSTFSNHDIPLRRLFHLAARRSRDIGEQVIAAAPGGRYSALGGFGPSGLSDEICRRVAPMPAAPNGYEFLSQPGTFRLFALDGTDCIRSHGDVKNEAACWALYSQVRPPDHKAGQAAGSR